jgi:uncharacterized membrane protein
MASPASALSAVASTLGWVAALAYPVVVYLGLTRSNPRTIAVVLLALWIILIPLRGLRGRAGQLRTVVGPLLPATLPLLGAALFDDGRFLLAVPVVVNLALLVGFAVTLRPGSRPMVERFARLQESALPEDAIAYCRAVTWVWCGFFVINAAVAGILAVTTVAGWALYTGFLAYVAMGSLWVGEIVVRKIRFRRYGRGAVDQWLAARFPPHPAADSGPRP